MKEENKKKSEKARKAGSVIEKIVLVALIITLCAILYNKYVVNDGDVKLFGYSQAVVVSGSMIPAIDINDIVIYKDVPYEEYKLKDVVIYLRGEKRICHRIIDIRGNRLITQGDANSVADEPISKDQLQGKVIKVIPKIGAISRWVVTPLGIFCLILFFLLAYKLPAIIRFFTKS